MKRLANFLGSIAVAAGLAIPSSAETISVPGIPKISYEDTENPFNKQDYLRDLETRTGTWGKLHRNPDDLGFEAWGQASIPTSPLFSGIWLVTALLGQKAEVYFLYQHLDDKGDSLYVGLRNRGFDYTIKFVDAKADTKMQDYAAKSSRPSLKPQGFDSNPNRILFAGDDLFENAQPFYIPEIIMNKAVNNEPLEAKEFSAGRKLWREANDVDKYNFLFLFVKTNFGINEIQNQIIKKHLN